MRTIANAPHWANWIAMDADGYESFHENEPLRGVDRWVSTGQKILVDGVANSPIGWEESLMQIQRFVNDNVKF